MEKSYHAAFGFALLGLALVTAGAIAQPYPVKPVRIIVAAAPGGGIDFIARQAGQKLGERFGQQFIVDNRAGAGGTIGTAQAARLGPDGYTLLLGFVGPLAMAPHAEKVGYDSLKDFAGVSLLASSYHVIAVHPSLPVRSVKQLIALAKARPGELNYASPNIWNPGHLAPELFKSVTGINIVAIHYKGTAPAAIAILTGEAQVIFTSATVAMPHVRSQRLVALAVTSPARLPLAPEVPTLAESGVRGVDVALWYALVAPVATPKGVMERLHGELVKITALPDYRALLQKQAFEPQTSTPEQFAAFLRAEHDKWGKVIGALKQQDTFSR